MEEDWGRQRYQNKKEIQETACRMKIIKTILGEQLQHEGEVVVNIMCMICNLTWR